MDTHSLSRRDVLSLLVVLCVAALLRLINIGVVSFQYDEAALSARAMDMVANRTLPTLGIPSSAGLPNSPATVYVLAIPYAISDSPIAATVYIAILNVAGVGLLWFLAYRYGNAVIAFVAGLAYAVNPWAITYSRKIWAQDYHTPILLLAVLLGLYGFAEKEPGRLAKWAQALCLPIFLFGVQIHFSAWALLPMYVWLLWLGRRNISRPAVAASILLSVLICVPFGIGLQQTFEVNPASLSGIAHNAASAGLVLSPAAVVDNALFASGSGAESLAGFPPGTASNVASPALLWLIIGLATLSGIAGLTTPSLRTITLLAILWVLLPVFVFTPEWTAVEPHYFISSLPMLALLAGIGVDSWLRVSRAQRFAAVGVVGTFTLVLATQGFWWENFIARVDTTPTGGDFSTPLHYLMDVRAALQPYKNVVVVTDDYWLDYNKEPPVWSVLLRNSAACVRAIGSNSFAVFPDGPFAVLTTPRASPNPVNGLYQTKAPVPFALRPGEGHYTIATFDQAPSWPGPTLTAIDPVHFDSGVDLIGYDLEKNAMLLEWRFAKQNGDELQYFGHFLDAQGNRLGQRDTKFVPGQYWCTGDRAISWIDINLPDKVRTLRVGMYAIGLGRYAGQFFASNVLNGSGQPVGQWVDIPLP